MTEPLAELIVNIAALGRGDVYAERASDGTYRPVRRPFTLEDAEKQLQQKAAYGIYLVEGDGTRSGVLDFDDHDQTADVETLVELALQVWIVLNSMGMKPVMFRSGGGRGVHIWVLFENRQQARAVRSMLRIAIGRCQLRDGAKGVAAGEVEIFPKQDRVDDGGLGNLIALPFARESAWINPGDKTVHERPAWTREWESALSPDAPPFSDKSNTPRRHAAPLPTDLEEASNALKFVPADDYDVWIRMLIALKTTFGDAGFDTWHEWSKSCPTKYRGEAACRPVWTRMKPGGKLGLGSIYFLAKQNGWNGPARSPIRDMNERFGILTHGSKTLIILKRDREPGDDLSFLGVRPFLDRLAPEKISVGSDGGSAPIGPLWMKHPFAAHYHRIVFDPSLPPGHNGTAWNIWEGFAYEPLPKSWDRLREHLFDNICGGSEDKFQWLLNWFALGLQKPSELIGTALVLRGAPGVGKSFVANCYGALWGSHYIAITQASHVLGRFNSHLFGRRVIFIDEGMFGGNRKEAGVIKTRVTEPTVILEQKGVDPIKVRNRSLLILASNEDSIVPADLNDRRWMVFDVSAKHKEDHAYFSAIRTELDSGGYEAMMFDLLNRDLAKGPDPRKIIKTEALFEQILGAQPAYVQYVHYLLDQRRLPQNRVAGGACTTIRAMLEDFRRLHPSDKYLTATALGRHIQRIIPDISTDHNGKYLVRAHYVGQGEYETSTRYLFPPVPAARKAFERFIGQDITWSDMGGDWLEDPYEGTETPI